MWIHGASLEVKLSGDEPLDEDDIKIECAPDEPEEPEKTTPPRPPSNAAAEPASDDPPPDQEGIEMETK